jgi:chlorophyll synthase/bacteriochlorophyll c synthase
MSRVSLSQPKPKTGALAQARAHIELADPVTWISPAITTICGALASSAQAGGFNVGSGQQWALVALGALMTGPLATGFSQSINDYYDHELDAINDPERPIPSGRVSLGAARWNWILLAVATLAVALIFREPLILLFAVIGLILSAIYSIPPIKLKAHYWLGAPAVGFGYVSMSWLVGHLIFAPLTWQSALVAFFNGGLATGLLFLNDIKSVEGDRQLGMKSLTVTFGVDKALIVAFTVITAFELALMVTAFAWGHPWVGGFVLLAMIVPLYSQIKLYRDPTHDNFKRYILASNPFIVLIQVISALVVGGYFG